MAEYPSQYLSAVPVRRVEEERDQAIAIAQHALLADSDPLAALIRIASLGGQS